LTDPPALVPGVEDKVGAAEKAEQSEAIAQLKRRHCVGYGVGALALVAAAVLAWHSFCGLSRIAKAWADSKAPLPVFYVNAGGHVVITIAVVWFIYQVLRAAERMVLPSHWANDVEMARTLLGIASPHQESLKILEKTLRTVFGEGHAAKRDERSE
jgi:hypothetical protein